MDKWDEIEKTLNHYLVPYMTKNEEKNRERTKMQRKAIQWMMKELRLGPMRGGVRGNSEMTEIPEFLYHFGSFVWEADRKCILLRDPICRICGKSESTEVHHIRPKHLKGSYYHPRNLVGLCEECHDEVHRRIDSGINEVIESSLEFEMDDSQKTLSDWE